ncbi:MAG: hypothetical protein ACQCN6_07440 [Candidatus Bathyarchaeia archaeon]
MKNKSLRSFESVKKTGTRMASALEGAATSVMLTAFKAISVCTTFALDRFSQNSKGHE